MKYSFQQFRIGPLMESERLLHPINQIGVDTQNGVIKEEKELSLRQPTLWKNITHRGKICLKVTHIAG
jgi:hypothetical protein